MTKSRKLEIIKYILTNYPKSCMYANHVQNVGNSSKEIVPVEEWDKFVDLTNCADCTDEITTDEISDFFMYELMKICGCGNPFRMIVLTASVLEEINVSGFPDKLGVTIPTSMSKVVGDDDFKLAFIYQLNGLGLTEHGCSISHMSLTELGKMVLDVFKDVLNDT